LLGPSAVRRLALSLAGKSHPLAGVAHVISNPFTISAINNPFTIMASCRRKDQFLPVPLRMAPIFNLKFHVRRDRP